MQIAVIYDDDPAWAEKKGNDWLQDWGQARQVLSISPLTPALYRGDQIFLCTIVYQELVRVSDHPAFGGHPGGAGCRHHLVSASAS